MNHISAATVYHVLMKEQLLKECVSPFAWHYAFPDYLSGEHFTTIHYDSREAKTDTLFFCKGRQFKEAYLNQALQNGVSVYVSEVVYKNTLASGFIVTDIQKAMAVIAREFYGNPQNRLSLIGITGTKGKTLTAYFTKAILANSPECRPAFLTSEQTCLDGKHYYPSKLTTPEALDLYAMMAKAVANKMTHLVMEVSSQAYKTNRVYGITFDVGIFLNISPDHIGPIEHPNFEDYLYCKRQLILNSRQMVINRHSDYFELLKETCEISETPMITYGRFEADYLIKDYFNEKTFSLSSHLDILDVTGDYELAVMGDFNHENAAAALLAATCVGGTAQSAHSALPQVTVPGRMQTFYKDNGALLIVDFAHNYLSLKTLSQLARNLRPDGRLILVTGSAGGKAESRRPDMGRAISEFYDVAFLTTDDPDFEDPQIIAEEIKANVTNEAVILHLELDRTKAVEEAFAFAQGEDAVIFAGKGVDRYLKVAGKSAPYEGDFEIVQRLLGAN